MPALNSAVQQPGGGQLLEFALHGADGSTCVACDLAKIVRFVRVTEQPAENPPACAAEQHRGGVGPGRRSHCGCSHNAYNRTQNGYACQTVVLVRTTPNARVAQACLNCWGTPEHALFARIPTIPGDVVPAGRAEADRAAPSPKGASRSRRLGARKSSDNPWTVQN